MERRLIALATGTLLLVVALQHMFCEISLRILLLDTKFYVRSLPLKKEYDFVVVGSGPGGATVASRLSEVSEWSVLLLEAGTDENTLTGIPILADLFKNTHYDWGYRAQPQHGACLGIKDGRCPWTRGKSLGGTSTINNLLYTRGHFRDFDDWEALGNPGWNWNNVLPYYLKSENARGHLTSLPNHTTGGMLDIETSYTFPITEAFYESAMELGLTETDLNSGKGYGFAQPQFTKRNGARISASKAFLRPARYRDNLHVVLHAHVTRVLIDPSTREAYGVEYFKNGRHWTVQAKQEVILSAGVINTPQILMLSGLGPRQHLEELGIAVLQDLPGVGQNLQEHVATPHLTFIANDTVTAVGKRLRTDIVSLLKYFIHGAGPITSTFIDGLHFIRSPNSSWPQDYPDIELIFVPASIASDGGEKFYHGIGIRDDIYNIVYAPLHDKDTWSIWIMLLRPHSRGWIHLNSKDPFEPPLMYGNYFADERDIKTMVEGIKFAVAISKTRAFQRYNSTLHDTPIPGCNEIQFASDEYWECVIRVLTYSGQHQCCTAKMGPKHDISAVVDHKLQVHGVNGLRVVDASVMPFNPAAHPMAPVYMIAEKAADFIKLRHAKP